MITQDKRVLPAKIKHFTLKATASAILTLNAEAVFATPLPSCAAEIFGDSPICAFDSTSSVTVENGGTLGGLVMDAYLPINSFILVNSGGAINNTTGIGISMQSSSLTNGLSNNGSIRSSATATGILITQNSTINGGISNTGMISSGSSVLSIDQSTIFGNIFNSGTAISTQAGTGILIRQSALTGDLLNSGTISGSSDDSGITIDNTTISGDLNNSGLINAIDGNAVLIHSNSVFNSITNTGRISSETQSGLGIDNGSNIRNSIYNSGTITGGLNGLAVHNAATVGGDIINTGSLQGGSNGLSIYSVTAISGGVTNSGTITGDTNGINMQVTSVIFGSLSNSGVIHGGTTGITAISSTIQGGISNSGTIQGSTNAINFSNVSISTIDILGDTARIIGAVEASTSHVNITTGAEFTSEGTYNVNTFNIANNAVFNMANTITAGTGVTNAGTLSLANRTESITGAYTQNTGGLFQTTITDIHTYGQLTASDEVNLSESGDIDVQIESNTVLHKDDVIANVISGQHLVAPLSGFTVSDNSFIWNFNASINNDNTGVNLTAAINPTATTVCQGAYCQGAVTSILGQIAGGNSLFNSYATLTSETAFQTAASQATPELTNENIQMVQLMTRAVVDIVPMWSKLRGQSAGDATFYPPGKIWLKPYGASMTQNARNTVNGFDATAYGAVIGKDIEFNDWMLGAAFAGGGDNMRGKAVLNGQTVRSSAYQIMLYAAKQLPSQIYFAGQGLVGYERSNTSRSIPLYASIANGAYNSWFTNIRAEAGWSTQVFSPKFVFTPEVDASYVFINQGRYQESGSLMDLSVAANDNSSLVLGAYANGAYHLATTKRQQDVTVTGYVGIAGDTLDDQPQTLATFVGSSASFTTFGVQFNGVVFRGGGGLVITNRTNPLTLELNYDLQVGNNAYSGIGGATIKYKQ